MRTRVGRRCDTGLLVSGKCNDAIQLYTEALSYDPQNFVYNATVYCNRYQRPSAMHLGGPVGNVVSDLEDDIRCSSSRIADLWRVGEAIKFTGTDFLSLI